MGHTIAPHWIRKSREAFGLSSSQFAAVLGVHPTTVSRWENASGPVVVEGMAWTVLTSLWHRLEGDRRARADAKQRGEAISRALLLAGAVAALAILVEFAAEQ